MAAPPNATVYDYESKVKLGRRLADAFRFGFATNGFPSAGSMKGDELAGVLEQSKN